MATATPPAAPPLVPVQAPAPPQPLVDVSDASVLYTESGAEWVGIDLPIHSWVVRDTGIRLFAEFGA